MPDTDSITIIKRFLYRGQQEEWSNTYHLSGTTPTDQAGWKTLADAIIAIEKNAIGDVNSYVRAYGYVAGQAHSAATIDYVALGGTLIKGQLVATTTSPYPPGDTAVMIRARAGTSSKGKPVYLRKYFHGCPVSGDSVVSAQQTSMVTFATAMLAGTLPGSMKWVGPQGQVASNPQALPFATTRTLKRRGKRPS